ncbi:MAG: TSUP family transporter, partial [Treponema sp.]|nr:TSUP family transporter [Treponema sp.]
MLFLAGFVDSIAGGGGLISLPAYLFAGLPIHTAIGTNKFSYAFGTGLSTFRYIRQKLVLAKLAVPSVAFGFLGSAIGARLSMLASELLLQSLLLAVLPAAAFCVLNKRLFKGGTEDELT